MEERLTCPTHGERPRKEWRCIREGVPVASGGTASIYVHQRSMCREWAIGEVDSPPKDRVMMAASSAVR